MSTLSDPVLSRVYTSTAALQSRLDPAEAERYRAFAAATLAQTRPTALAGSSPEEAALALLRTWELLRDARGPVVDVTAEGRDLAVTTVLPDQPFIVDTIRKGLRHLGATEIHGFNVIHRIVRDGGGCRLVEDAEGRPESIVRLTVEGIAPTEADAVRADLAERLELVRACVADFEAMTTLVEAAADAAFDVGGEDGIETAEFLRWLLSDNFVFLGLTRHAAEAQLFGADRLGERRLWPKADPGLVDGVVQVRKGTTEAPIHRNGRIDEVRVALPSGQVVIRGMFTHRALTQACRHLPILRRVLATVLTETRSRPNSYRYRGLANVFDALPTEWLFAATPAQVRDVIELVFDADQDRTARVHVTQQDGGGTTLTLMAIPERRYSEDVRSRILGFLTSLTGATYSDSGIFAGRFDTVLVQVFQTGTHTLAADDVRRVQQYVVELTAPWVERVSGALDDRFGERSPELLSRYADAFPTEYVRMTPGDISALDIDFLERSRASGHTLAWVGEEGEDVVIRTYEIRDLLLTDLLPIIDAFGVVVTDSSSVTVNPRGLGEQHIDNFRVSSVPGIDRTTLLGRASLLTEGLAAVFRGDIASDNFNRLVLRAGLKWQEVDLVRAYVGYARQLGIRHTIPAMQATLVNQADCVHAIVDLFHAKFDPDLAGDRAAAVASAAARVDDLLRLIRTNDEDLVMRTLANLVDATLRTNFYRTDRKFHYLSFKVEHARIKTMPLPRMMYEIYVHHREVEGVHLRGGPIARGGIRFSDRVDFRTEVLGLVSTQMVKNVVIVPEGSKGGFYIKYTIDDAAERRRKGDELYQVLIRGLLDVTDNIVAGKVVRPPRVVAHDGDDPYLVVAADKGTAHLSDTANRLSIEYGFWLGDAFASGGSNGYDHKAVGITARGAWVLVKRLFREMGMDAMKDVFTCFGVGDCGGDVFGNGVIETDRMKLLAAFNHVHIFLDPDPDPLATYAERRRLFDAVKGWDGYDRSLISKGGGIFDRKAKSIPLSPEVKQMLGTLDDELTPDQVINLILKMPVDLFWNGGIGTYVRATHETNADANDPPNDMVRVSAAELRCKVVGEGGNLGFTQSARIEYALRGGRLNTDFVDNSGGVDTSDHEVNLKILLNPMVAAGRITTEQRNDFLRSLTDEVADAVLEDCNANGRLVSLDVVRSARDPNAYGRAIDWVCQRGNVSRQFLSLPSDDELRRRAAERKGLVRPELCTLQAHVKMHVYKMLLASDPAESPAFDQVLRGYFPGAVRETYGADIPGHMLAKAIGMTSVLTSVCTDAGAPFFPMMMDLTGASAARVAGAWLEAVRLAQGDTLREALAGAHARPEGAHYAWTLFTDGLTDLVASWLAPGSAGPSAEAPAQFEEAIRALAHTRSAADANLARNLVQSHVAKGIPESVSQRIVDAANAGLASEVAALARARGESMHDAAVRYQAVGHASRLLPTVRAIGARRGEGRWDPVARGILKLRYAGLLRELVGRTTLSTEQIRLGVDRAAATLTAGSLQGVSRVVEQIVGEAPDVPNLLVAEQQIRAVM